MLVTSPRIHLLRSKQQGSKQGFTLIELLMVIAVILILAGITFGISRGVQNAQARAKAKAELATISQALEQFKSRYGDYPWHISGQGADTDNNRMLLYALTGRLKLEANASGVVQAVEVTSQSEIDANPKFIDDTKFSTQSTGNATTRLLDPWGNPYIYWYKWNDDPDSWDVFGYHLYSTGAKGDTANDALKTKIDTSTGVIDNDFRDTANAEGIIFAGE